MNYITLNDGVKIPQVGFGTWAIPNDGTTYKAVVQALKAGYRHIDTAAAYFNEEEVGKAVKDSGIPCGEIFITSKLWLQDYGYEPAKNGIKRSLRKLGTYIDLYLIHQPYGDVPGAWRAMEEYKAAGKIRSIGVSNMTVAIWNKFIPELSSVPSVNQIEFHPFNQRNDIRKLMNEKNVMLEAWGPLGQGNQDLLTHPVIKSLSEKYSKDAGQIIIRSQVQEGVVTLPKSLNPERMKSNLDVFDFELTVEEMKMIRTLDETNHTEIHNPDSEGMDKILLNAFVIKD